MRLALEIVTLVIGCVLMLIVLPRPRARRRSRPRPSGSIRPADLERLERAVSGAQWSGGELHLRLRPVLRELAAARLDRRGIRLDQSPDTARELLGSELWELVRADRPRAADSRGTGLSLDELEAMTDRLERL